LACRSCTARRGWEAIIGQQRHYIEAVLDGRMLVRLARTSRAYPYHVALFGDAAYQQWAFCEASLKLARLKETVKFADGMRLGCCAACVEVLDAVIERYAQQAEEEGRVPWADPSD
jgi:hypothetical protein